MIWTTEQVERLRQLWEGGETARNIGRELNCSRNAVIGKAHRLRLIKRKEKSSMAPKRRRRRRGNFAVVRGKLSERQPPTPLPVPTPNALGVPLLELGLFACRFIIDSDDRRAPTHLYCGGDASQFGLDNCYCAFHQTRMRAHR